MELAKINRIKDYPIISALVKLYDINKKLQSYSLFRESVLFNNRNTIVPPSFSLFC